MSAAIGVVAALLLLGVIVRRRFPLLQKCFIPASVIAGFLGLAAVTLLSALSSANTVSASPSPTFLDTLASQLVETLSGWPGPLIAVVFATMLLQRPAGTHDKGSQSATAARVGRQGLMVWIIVLGETAVGLMAAWLLITPNYEVPNSIGMLIETGFAGGHGTAAAMGQVFASPDVGLAAGEGLGMLMATGGLVLGVVLGIGWINVANRLGWVRSGNELATASAATELNPIGYQRVKSDTMDPLLLQLVWIGLAVGLGMLMQFCVLELAGWIDGLAGFGTVANTDGNEAAQTADAELAKRLTIRRIVDFPLFIYTLFGGFGVRRALQACGQEERIDSETIARISGSAMEVLVVAAITSLKLSLVIAYAGPLIILLVCGAIWTSICLMVLSRFILPREHWFELALINFGMSTGTTATGFVLLRLVDPELKTSAASDYALAAQLSAPFIGGGMITIALPLLVLERAPLALSALAISTVVAILIGIGIWLGRGPKRVS